LGTGKNWVKRVFAKTFLLTQEVTQMVMSRKQHNAESRAKQASNEVKPEPNKIGASTPYDFSAKNLTPYCKT
jgi:hypothetical protein